MHQSRAWDVQGTGREGSEGGRKSQGPGLRGQLGAVIQAEAHRGGSEPSRTPGPLLRGHDGSHPDQRRQSIRIVSTVPLRPTACLCWASGHRQ